jgi:PEP-CTERM motif-containing protein
MSFSRITSSLAVTAAILFASVASAATIYEPFAYANGALSGNTNGTAPSTLNGFSDTNKWTQTTTNTQVIDGDLTFSGLPTTSTGHMGQLRNANDNPVHLGIGEYPLGATIYFSMLVQVPSNAATFGSSTTTGSFFSGLQFNPRAGAGNDMAGTSATGGGVMTIRADPAGGGYNLGIAFRDAPAATTRIFNSTKFLGGDTVFVVGKLATGSGSTDDVATLYLNPNPTLAEPGIASAVSANSVATGTNDYNTGVDTPPTLRSFFLRSNGVEPTNINIDEVRIGASWEEVTGQAFVVPEPATISMLAVAVVGLLARRRFAA